MKRVNKIEEYFPEHIIKIKTGYPGGNGHKKSDEWYFKSNYSNDDLKKAYSKSVELTGADFHRECSEYEESSLSTDCIESLYKHGIPIFDYIDIEPEELIKLFGSLDYAIESGEIEKWIGVKDYVFLIMKFISLSMPEDFVYSQYNNDIPFLGTFGYGLYD